MLSISIPLPLSHTHKSTHTHTNDFFSYFNFNPVTQLKLLRHQNKPISSLSPLLCACVCMHTSICGNSPLCFTPPLSHPPTDQSQSPAFAFPIAVTLGQQRRGHGVASHPHQGHASRLLHHVSGQTEPRSSPTSPSRKCCSQRGSKQEWRFIVARPKCVEGRSVQMHLGSVPLAHPRLPPRPTVFTHSCFLLNVCVEDGERERFSV